MLDSLVRVSRRVGTSNFARIANNSEGNIHAGEPNAVPSIALLSEARVGTEHRAPQPRRVSVVTTLRCLSPQRSIAHWVCKCTNTDSKARRYYLSQRLLSALQTDSDLPGNTDPSHPHRRPTVRLPQGRFPRTPDRNRAACKYVTAYHLLISLLF